MQKTIENRIGTRREFNLALFALTVTVALFKNEPLPARCAIYLIFALATVRLAYELEVASQASEPRQWRLAVRSVLRDQWVLLVIVAELIGYLWYSQLLIGIVVTTILYLRKEYRRS